MGHSLVVSDDGLDFDGDFVEAAATAFANATQQPATTSTAIDAIFISYSERISPPRHEVHEEMRNEFSFVLFVPSW
jgi:hypothetical protein